MFFSYKVISDVIKLLQWRLKKKKKFDWLVISQHFIDMHYADFIPNAEIK